MNRKKKIRLFLACTVFIPVWLAIGGAVAIFPGFITFFIAPFWGAYLCFKLWLSEDLDEYDRKEIKGRLFEVVPLMFAPITAMIVVFYFYIKDGKFNFN